MAARAGICVTHSSTRVMNPIIIARVLNYHEAIRHAADLQKESHSLREW